MVYAMVFGAHLFPYSWLYKSNGYTVAAISIPMISLILGCALNGTTVAVAACIIEIVFACVLHMELKKMGDYYNKSQFVELSKDKVSMK